MTTAVTPVKTQDIDDVLSQQLGNFTKLYKISTPFTTIVNRAQCVDPSKDHLPRLGVNRTVIQQWEEIQGEYGPSNQKVYKPSNDLFDQVRLVGAWAYNTLSNSITYGPYTQAQTTSDYIEITFYGTGLNILTYTGSSTYSAVAAVDGGAEGSNFFPTLTGASAIIGGRNYSVLTPVNVVKNLTLGTHTVKIRNTDASAGLIIYGYETLNENTSLQLVPGSSYNGGKKVINSALTTDTYSSNFESGTLTASNGGHVVVYQKPDGTIKKAIQSYSGSPLYQGSADHSGESLIYSYSWREFGAGRSDDFSTLTSSSRAAAFTLDDGTTTLSADSVSSISYNSADGLRPAGNNNFITITFVGTGLDLLIDTDGNGTRTYNLVVDGGSTLTGIVPSVKGQQIVKVVSGLPYGTHTVKYISTNASSSTPGILRYLVYGPSKPTVPVGCVELCDYYVLGSFSVASTSANTSISNTVVSQGVLRKNHLREFIYIGGGWTVNSDTTAADNVRLQTVSTADYLIYVFFGTGFDLRYFLSGNNATNATVSIDGSTNLSSFTTQMYGGTSFTASTGVLNQASSGSGLGGLAISGLSLGIHTIKITYTSGGSAMRIDAFDIITPIHSPKSITPGAIQSTPSVGNQGIGDSRKFGAQSTNVSKNWTQVVGVSSNPTTTSSSPVPLADMVSTIKTSGNPIQINYSVVTSNNTTGCGTTITVYVDGVAQIPTLTSSNSSLSSAINSQINISGSLIVPVSAGVHNVMLFWNQAGGGTSTASSTQRILTVKEDN